MEDLNKSPLFVKTEGVEWEVAGEGVRRKILAYDENLMMVRVEFKSGAVGYLHTHPHRQVTYVESGRFEVEISGKKEVLGRGDCFIVEPDEPHGVAALEDGGLVDVFTPAREDFLRGK